MTITKLNISCVWSGTLTGILLKNDTKVAKTTKIIGIHGWLDNLNSLLPLAEKLLAHHSNYEIYLYDRAGHGFSSHLPKGFDYSNAHNLQDLRNIIQTLGWNNEQFSIIGHSYGAMIGLMYAASYPEEVLCVVAIDTLIRINVSSDSFWTAMGSRLDTNLKHFRPTSKTYTDELTFEKALAVTKSTRPGITDEAVKLLVERSVRRDSNNKLHFTRDESLKILSLFPFTADAVGSAVKSMKASVLFIGTFNPLWPKTHNSIDLFKEHQPKFEMTLIDGPHHLHMTHVDEVVTRIEQYFDKYLPQASSSVILNSKL